MSLLRTTIEAINRLATSINRFKRHDVAELARPIKVNLGCGLAVTPGWVNIDGSLNALVAGWPTPFLKVFYQLAGASRFYSKEAYCELLTGNRFIHHDLAAGIPLADAAVDVVYSSHFLEHLYRDEATHLLTEARRVLVPGGLIRISVPDLAYAVSLYGDGRTETMLTDYFFVEDIGSIMARHKFMYDELLLTDMLAAAGFSEIIRCGFRQGECPDIEMLDNRENDSLFMEARA